jgi:predicted CoA-binding protein
MGSHKSVVGWLRNTIGVVTAQSSSDEIGALLKRAKTVAVVGLSDSPLRPSHGVSAYLQQYGYRIIPVNPNIQGALGEKAVAKLADVKEKIDIVDIFRRSDEVAEVVDEAIKLRVPAIWMQEGVIDEKAAEKARQAGIFVVMDRCILKEHRRRFSQSGRPF